MLYTTVCKEILPETDLADDFMLTLGAIQGFNAVDSWAADGSSFLLMSSSTGTEEVLIVFIYSIFINININIIIISISDKVYEARGHNCPSREVAKARREISKAKGRDPMKRSSRLSRLCSRQTITISLLYHIHLYPAAGCAYLLHVPWGRVCLHML